MAASRVVHMEDVGPVLFERSRRAKRVNITVRPFVGVRVSVPYRMSFKEAQKVALPHKAWILRQLQRIRTVRHKHAFLIDLANDINWNYARNRLVNRLEKLAGRYGFRYNRVFIRAQKTRWGSCSAKNNISLNVRLVLLPVELMDYVILHELVHTRIKSHSPAFWKKLDKYTGRAKEKHRKLSEFGMAFL